MTQPLTSLTPAQLKTAIADGHEIALIDVREEGLFGLGHLLLSSSAPLSRLELLIERLVPRRGARLVLIDAQGETAPIAAQRLQHAGYHNLHVLAGGTTAWVAAGYPLFDGVYVPSKAFGEVIEHTLKTPVIDVDALEQLRRDGVDHVVVDSRPWEEYRLRTIPGAINCPGAELAQRIQAIAPDPETLVVVNCGGRTRSILGAQTLIHAAIPNPVLSLKDGAQGWVLSGRKLEVGADRVAPYLPAQAPALAQARKVAQQAGVQIVNWQTVQGFVQQDSARSVFLLDVRGPQEYQASHLAGWRHAPGGQLVQSTDHYVGTLRARVVLHDPQLLRALTTAAWVQQLGLHEVFVLEQAPATAALQAGPEIQPVLPVAFGDAVWIQPSDLAALQASAQSDAVAVFDIDSSLDYRHAHIPGSWHAGRPALGALWATEPDRFKHTTLVITSADGTLAGLAAAEWRRATGRDVRALLGGTQAWQQQGLPTEAGLARAAPQQFDRWYGPWAYEGEAQLQAFRDYLSWEVDLAERIHLDGDLPIQLQAVA